jgi:hypothetical protein
MNALLLIIAAAILVAGLILCQWKVLKKNQPNAEMLTRFYQMVT